jgi:hypothetical protein
LWDPGLSSSFILLPWSWCRWNCSVLPPWCTSLTRSPKSWVPLDLGLEPPEL